MTQEDAVNELPDSIPVLDDVVEDDTGTAPVPNAARRSLEGEFSRRVDATLEGLTALRVWIEAALDFHQPPQASLPTRPAAARAP